MDFLKSTVSCVNIHGFWMSVFTYPWHCADINIDIQTRISMQEHSTIEIREIWKSTNESHVLWTWVFNYPCFSWYSFGYLLNSIDIHACSLLAMDYRSRSSPLLSKKWLFTRCPILNELGWFPCIQVTSYLKCMGLWKFCTVVDTTVSLQSLESSNVLDALTKISDWLHCYIMIRFFDSLIAITSIG